MTNSMTEVLQQMVDYLIADGHDVFTYAGRGTYGNACLAVSTEGSNIGSVLSSLMNWSSDYRSSISQSSKAGEALGAFGRVTRALRPTSTDAGVGYNSLVYFPGISTEDLIHVGVSFID